MPIGRMLIALVAIGLVGAACSSGDDSEDAGGGSGGRAQRFAYDASAPELQPAPGALGGGDGAGGSSGDESASGSAVTSSRPLTAPDLGPNVIKTADIRLEVPRDGFRAAVQDAIATAEARGGFVLTSEVSGTKELRGSVVLRVPAESFEAALAELKDLGKIRSENITGQDVTEEFVDLDARLRNLEAQETVLLRLMDRATTVSGTIKVQRELSGIQLEIERLRGRLRFLQDQTSFSTLRVDLVQAGAVAPEPAGALTKAWRNARDTFVAVVSAVIVGAGFLIPVAFFLLLVALAVRVARPRFTSS